MSYLSTAVITSSIGTAGAGKFNFALSQSMTLRPIEEYIEIYKKNPTDIQAIAPDTMSSLYGLVYAITQHVEGKKLADYTTAMGIVLQCCKVEDNLSRSEIFAMFLMMICDQIKKGKNSSMMKKLAITDVFHEALTLGQDIQEWADQIQAA